MRKVVIAGGTGFIGHLLCRHFACKGDQILVLTRGQSRDANDVRYIHWDAKTLGDWVKELEDAAVLINLTGKSVDCRYHQANKEEILNSRIDATTILGKALSQLNNPPRIWLNASSATIYAHSLDVQMNETDGTLGSGFSVEVCKAWEKSFFKTQTDSTRKVALRLAIVFGSKGGALDKIKSISKLGLGGKQGKGNQFVSWVHEKDMIRAIEYIIQNPDISGSVNISSPYPVQNAEFMKMLRTRMKIPFGLPMHAKLLSFGAILIKTETELILKSRNVIPTRLLEAGFKFEFPKLENALDDLI